MSKVQVQPGFMPPGDDVMALVAEVGGALRSMLKNEQANADLKKSESVVTGDPQIINTGGKKSAPHVATSAGQTMKGERSAAETSSSGGGKLPVKKSSPSASESSESSMSKGSPSYSESSMSKASPSADEGSASAGGPPMGSPSAGGPSAGGDEGAPAGAPPMDDAGAPPPTDDAGAPPPEGGDQAGAAPSFEELVQMYSQLPPEDLQAHMAAIEQVAQGQSGAGAPGGAPGGAPPSPAAPPPAPSPTPSPGPGMPPGMMGKSEEKYLAELKKTQDQVAAIAEAVSSILTMPKRKAVNGLSFIPFQKSEEPVATGRPSFEDLKRNPTALHAELKKMTAPESGLAKSQRDMVTDFYCRRINIDELAPLFQDKK